MDAMRPRRQALQVQHDQHAIVDGAEIGGAQQLAVQAFDLGHGMRLGSRLDR